MESMILFLDNDTELHLTNEKFAEALIQTINANREHLSTFLSWVDFMQTKEDAVQYLQQCESLQSENKEISFVILWQKKLVGRVGIHFISEANKCGAIGYWLSKDATGNGIITNACKKILAYGFEQLNLKRVELKAATTNYKSQAIAERLNFTKEGTLRQAEFVNAEYQDLYLYSMLQEEWQNRK